MATRYTLATTAQTQTLTNKTIDADDNTISNIGYGECETQFRLGWTIPITGTLTRDSEDDPTYVMKIAGVDWTDILSAGMRIKWTQDSTFQQTPQLLFMAEPITIWKTREVMPFPLVMLRR